MLVNISGFATSSTSTQATNIRAEFHSLLTTPECASLINSRLIILSYKLDFK